MATDEKETVWTQTFKLLLIGETFQRGRQPEKNGRQKTVGGIQKHTQ